MIAIVVGPQSTQGKIDEILKSYDEGKSPLQEKLETIASDIGKFGLYSAILIVFILLVRFTIERVDENAFGTEHIVEMVKFFILGVTVIVVAIPEGLPLSVTLSLAFSTQKMLKDKNLVRKMQACETMGGANTICSDKTGTAAAAAIQMRTFADLIRVIFYICRRNLDVKHDVRDNIVEFREQSHRCEHEQRRDCATRLICATTFARIVLASDSCEFDCDDRPSFR